MGLPRTPADGKKRSMTPVARSAELERGMAGVQCAAGVICFTDGTSMEYLKIKNWGLYQHYKDRSPPWIKLHYELMTSQDWVMADDQTRLLMVVCMMIASRHDGGVPNDPHYIQRVAYMDSKPNLFKLIESGFLLADASVVLADATECLIRGEERRVDTEESREESPVPVDDAPDRPEAERLCRILRDGITDNRPNAKVPTPGDSGWIRWVSDMDLMLRRDSRTEDEAAAVIRWATTDDFWKSNILSPSKLRKQYDRLALQMRRPATGGRKDYTADTKAALDGALRIMRGGK